VGKIGIYIGLYKQHLVQTEATKTAVNIENTRQVYFSLSTKRCSSLWT